MSTCRGPLQADRTRNVDIRDQMCGFATPKGHFEPFKVRKYIKLSLLKWYRTYAKLM